MSSLEVDCSVASRAMVLLSSLDNLNQGNRNQIDYILMPRPKKKNMGKFCVTHCEVRRAY